MALNHSLFTMELDNSFIETNTPHIPNKLDILLAHDNDGVVASSDLNFDENIDYLQDRSWRWHFILFRPLSMMYLGHNY